MRANGAHTLSNALAAAGIRSMLGYPVVVSQVFPNTTAVSTIPVVFGNLNQAASFGDRRQETISFSDQASVGGESTWERDEIAVKGTQRFDINVHDIGSATAPGPIVGLETKAS
jgi:HK97 family phage major capsid protein